MNTNEICPLSQISPMLGHRLVELGKGYRTMPNNDRCCNYCGSLHPEQFLKFVDSVIDDPNPDIRIEFNNRGDKIYIEREGVKNASEGAIKCYVDHIREYCVNNNIDLEETASLLNRAVKVSNEKYSVVSALNTELRKNNML